MIEVEVKKGFTLVEVLIALAIIGVVAAITLPILNKKIQHKVFEVRFKNAVSLVNQAIQYAKYDTQIENFAKYCKVNDTVITKFCIESVMQNFRKISERRYSQVLGKFSIIRTFDDIYTYNGNIVHSLSSNQQALLQMNDIYNGIYVGIYSRAAEFTVGIDLNGAAKPNRLGYDIFLFKLNNNDILTFYGKPNNATDEEAENYYANSTSNNKYYEIQIYGAPCNLTSTRKGNGLGCTYYALKNECPWDSTKTYWECLP